MPDTVDVCSGLQEAVLLHQSGQLKQAATIYQQVLDIEPENANALHLLGLVSHQSGQSETAITLIEQALNISPNQLNYLHNLANILKESGQFEEAVKVYSQVIQLQSGSAETYNNLGISLYKLNQFQSAAQAYQTAIALNPEYAEAYNNFGNALQKQDKLEEAIQAYQTAIALNPEYAEAYGNYGLALRKQGKLDQSVQAYQTAIRISPDYAEAHNNLGLVLLLKGDYENGWKEYEWRLKCRAFEIHDRDFPQPYWKGSDIDGKVILIWGELCVGDQIMFASRLFRLQQKAERILVETQQRLVPLFRRSFPNICFFPTQDPPDSRLLGGAIDHQAPIGNLAQRLLPNEESFPKSQSYLKVCADKTEKLRNKYQKLAIGKLLIGVSWMSVNKHIGKHKSTSLIQW